MSDSKEQNIDQNADRHDGGDDFEGHGMPGQNVDQNVDQHIE